MTCYHLQGAPGEVPRLEILQLSTKQTYVGTVRSLDEVPCTVAGIADFADRKPDSGLHAAPQRQFLVVLRGELEIEPKGAMPTRLGVGDVLLADDVDSEGHHSRDVGAQPLMMMMIQIEPTWSGPLT